jgi:ElaB/YqjD/DUF883 family membrane-anchored ribosome-binding protein
MGEETTRIREEIEQTRERMSDTVGQLAHKANVPGRAKESVVEKRDRLMDQMKGTASKVSDATPDATDVKHGARQAVGVAQENPLGLALGGVAAGFLLGMVLPSTRIEDERVGPMADEVKQSAAETGQEALERGKQVAQDAAQAASEAAQEAAENVKETVQESGRDQAEQLRDSAEEQGQKIGRK